MRRPAPSCFETAASPPPQHEESEIGFTRFRQSKCASRINPTCVVKPAGDGSQLKVAALHPGYASTAAQSIESGDESARRRDDPAATPAHDRINAPDARHAVALAHAPHAA